MQPLWRTNSLHAVFNTTNATQPITMPAMAPPLSPMVYWLQSDIPCLQAQGFTHRQWTCIEACSDRRGLQENDKWVACRYVAARGRHAIQGKRPSSVKSPKRIECSAASSSAHSLTHCNTEHEHKGRQSCDKLIVLVPAMVNTHQVNLILCK